eukprot:CFRG3213T1
MRTIVGDIQVFILAVVACLVVQTTLTRGMRMESESSSLVDNSEGAYDNFASLNSIMNGASVDGANYNVKTLMNYGNWCGGGHGGFQDCCNGTACPNCQIAKDGFPLAPLTDACLKECPPVDSLDEACAMHDSCTFNFKSPGHMACVPQGNYCSCDCHLIADAKISKCGFLDFECYSYRFLMESLFEVVTDCWFDDTANSSVGCLQDSPAKYGQVKPLVTDFC